MSDQEVDEFLGGASPAFKFDKVGDMVSGTVLSSKVRQQTDYKTSKPKFYEDGNPMNQLVIALQTELSDPEIDDDDGVRSIYVKGAARKALREAIGRKKFRAGGTLWVKFDHQEEPARRGEQGMKIYKFKYEPPVEEVTLGDEEDPF